MSDDEAEDESEPRRKGVDVNSLGHAGGEGGDEEEESEDEDEEEDEEEDDDEDDEEDDDEDDDEDDGEGDDEDDDGQSGEGEEDEEVKDGDNGDYSGTKRPRGPIVKEVERNKQRRLVKSKDMDDSEEEEMLVAMRGKKKSVPPAQGRRIDISGPAKATLGALRADMERAACGARSGPFARAPNMVEAMTQIIQHYEEALHAFEHEGKVHDLEHAVRVQHKVISTLLEGFGEMAEQGGIADCSIASVHGGSSTGHATATNTHFVQAVLAYNRDAQSMISQVADIVNKMQIRCSQLSNATSEALLS